MSSSRAQILTLLKRNGGRGVSELAGALHLAPVTIRQHLTRLERDGLVRAERASPVSGRPRYLFRLTAKAHAAAFPRRSDRLVELLVREIGALDGRQLIGLSAADKTTLVLQRLADRLADEYVPLLRGWPLQERVVFVTEVMHSDGGFAEWEQTERGYEIRDFNCLFHRLLESGGGEVCEWHQGFLSRMLGAEVRVDPCDNSTPGCCRYTVEPAPAVEQERPQGVLATVAREDHA
ncbi:MAG: ArsR family transcriptional regulator [Dehalococcoidia bacterium]|nr:ArsR family transcriptional regulator [Dehalococcoidia bacterium]